MESDKERNLTELVNLWSDGDAVAGDELFGVINLHLKKMAQKRLRSESDRRRFRVTEVVDDTFVRLANQRNVRWDNRQHFFGVVATLMNRAIVDAMRYGAAGIRDWRLESSADAPGSELANASELTNPEVLHQVTQELELLDQALQALEADNPVAHAVLVRRAFEDRTLHEIGADLHLSVDATHRKWKYATAFLAVRLSHLRRSAGA